MMEICRKIFTSSCIQRLMWLSNRKDNKESTRLRYYFQDYLTIVFLYNYTKGKKSSRLLLLDSWCSIRHSSFSFHKFFMKLVDWSKKWFYDQIERWIKHFWSKIIFSWLLSNTTDKEGEEEMIGLKWEKPHLFNQLCLIKKIRALVFEWSQNVSWLILSI